MPVHSLTTQKLEQPVPDTLRLYLDQMFRLDVAQALRGEGYNVIRASEVGQDGQMTVRYCKKRLLKAEFLSLLMNILVIGLSCRFGSTRV